MTTQTKSSIALFNGDFFDFNNPRNHQFDIKSIAHALSNLCRYTGHVNSFYSVAEHSVLVSQCVPPEFALEGLMHDASEAYVGDVASPLKRLLPGYQKIEDAAQEAISLYFGLQFPFPSAIHDADKSLYIAERRSIASCGTDAMWFTDSNPAAVKIHGYQPKQAKDLFLKRFNELYVNQKLQKTAA